MDHPFSFSIPWIRIVNRWIVVVYFSLVHPVLLYRRYHNGGMEVSTYFWIGMALLVLLLYLPQVIRDVRQAVRIEFDGLVLTLGFLFRANQIITISEVQAILHHKRHITLVADTGEIKITSQLPSAAYKLLNQLHQKFGAR